MSNRPNTLGGIIRGMIKRQKAQGISLILLLALIISGGVNPSAIAADTTNSNERIISAIQETVNRADPDELHELKTKLEERRAWQIDDLMQRAFWNEVVYLALTYATINDCSARGLWYEQYSLNWVWYDLDCWNETQKITRTLPHTEAAFNSYLRALHTCERSDAARESQFKRARLIVLAANERYSCTLHSPEYYRSREMSPQ